MTTGIASPPPSANPALEHVRKHVVVEAQVVPGAACRGLLVRRDMNCCCAVGVHSRTDLARVGEGARIDRGVLDNVGCLVRLQYRHFRSTGDTLFLFQICKDIFQTFL